MSELAGERIAQQLMLWALLCLGSAVFGLWRTGHAFWRPFWFMTGVWALINAGIAFAGWLGGEPSPQELRRLLLINAGLDVLYLLAGAALFTRPRPMLKGFGLAVLIQGAFLLAFDLWHGLTI